MKTLVIGAVVWAWLAMSPMAHAGVSSWPIVGQVAQVGTCVLGKTGSLVGSLVGKLSAWGGEVLSGVGECINTIVGITTEAAVDVVNLEVPVPPTEEHTHE